MEKFDEMLKELNDLKIIQKSMDWSENIPEDIYNEWFKGYFKTVGWGIDTVIHRWYENSTTVIEMYGRYLGIYHVSNIYSESSEVEDIYFTMGFSEMEQIQITSYKEKQINN